MRSFALLLAILLQASSLGACATTSGPSQGGGDDDGLGVDAQWPDPPLPDARVVGTPDAAVPPPPADAAPPAPDAAPPPPPALVMYAHSASDLYAVDTTTMAETHVGPFVWPAPIMFDSMTDIAVNQTGEIYGISFTRVYRVDRATGACTHLSDLATNYNGLSFVPAGVIDPIAETLVGTSLDGNLWKLDPMTGVATLIGPYGGGLQSSGDIVSVAGVGTAATVKPPGSTTDWLALVDPTSGAATLVGDTGVTDIWGLGWADGALYGFTATNQFVRLDPATGAATVMGVGTVSWWGAGVTTSAAGM
jgi:hypothetical protein